MNLEVPSIPKQGYGLVPAVGANQQATHTFCGEHEIRNAQCPNCRLPLLLLLRLDASDRRLAFDSSKYSAIPLLYCWRCALAEAEFTYRVEQADKIEILSMRLGE
jgi:hypothetical protein